jgi:hypothetical protein
MTDYNNVTATLNGMVGQTILPTAIPGTDEFTRTNKVFGIGVDYRF